MPLRLAGLIFVTCLLTGLVGACERGPVVAHHTDFVMGTLAELTVVAEPTAGEAALEQAMEELRRIDGLVTGYSTASEAVRLGRHAGDGDSVPVSEDTDRILALASAVAEGSGGAFDPTALPLVEAWGFPTTPARPDSATLAVARARVAWRKLIRVGVGAWRLDEPGMGVDLGGIAKGYAVDRAAELLVAPTGNCLVSVGGDLAVRGHHPDRDHWRVGVQDPRDPARLFLTLRLSGAAAVATSGDYQRFFEVDGVRYHHLIDPRTGRPARALRSATVVAPTCALADAWATAAFILGPEAGLAALESHPDLEGVLVETDAAGELRLHETSGLAALKVDPR